MPSEQLSMFTARETIGAKRLKGRPLGPIGGGDLALRVQDTRPRASLPIEQAQPQVKARKDFGVCYAPGCASGHATHRRVWTRSPEGTEYDRRHQPHVHLCQLHAQAEADQQFAWSRVKP